LSSEAVMGMFLSSGAVVAKDVIFYKQFAIHGPIPARG
jgi:hypothetical protein